MNKETLAEKELDFGGFAYKDIEKFIRDLKKMNINKTGKTLIIPMKDFDKRVGEGLLK